MALLTGWQAVVKALCLEGIQFVYGPEQSQGFVRCSL